MRNIAKKIAAFALAFTLLGTGTAVTKTISPDFNTAITASAACNHSAGQPRVVYGTWDIWPGTTRPIKMFGLIVGYEALFDRYNYYYCSSCGKFLYQQYEKQYRRTM